jgi:hypothetical protein
MTAFEAKLQRFECFADECEVLAKRAIDVGKRELYVRLGAHYRELAADMRTVIATIDVAA